MFKNKSAVVSPLLFMVFIFILSSIPGSDIPVLVPRIQDFLHIPLFAALALLWIRAFSHNNFDRRKAIFYTLIITILYSFFDEFHQSFTPGRDASFYDVLSDIIGSAVGTFIYRYKK
ncbi:MAG: VanZ family protein [Candidatus Omnitrophica bacterium]|nr:VanZ family protein [Candidatus Omnitrophota bacterium]